MDYKPEDLEDFIINVRGYFQGIDYKWINIESIYLELLEMEERNECEERIFKVFSLNREYQQKIDKIIPPPKNMNNFLLSYYDWDCRPIMFWEWTVKRQYFPVHAAEDVINGWYISTVWLGINHALNSYHEPIIFETMIFKDNDETPDNEFCSYYQERYSTYAEALEGHQKACEAVRNLKVFLDSRDGIT